MAVQRIGILPPHPPGRQRAQRTRGFLVLFAYAVALFFAASLILPSTASEGCDLRNRYESIRRPFFALVTGAAAIEITDSLVKGGIDRVLTVLGPNYVIMVTTWVLFGLVAMYSADRRVHWVGAVALFVMNLGFVVTGWSVLQ